KTFVRSVNGATPAVATLSSDASNVASPVCVNPGGCAIGDQPSKVTISVTESSTKASATQYSFALTGSRRMFLNTGGASASSFASILTLGTSGTTVTVSGGTLNVAGQVTVNSTSSGAVSRSGGSLNGSIGIVTPGTCSGCTSTPLNAPVPDPYADFPQCPSAAGCPTGTAVPLDLNSNQTANPGVYSTVSAT